MKKSLVVIGFILSALLSLVLMQLPEKFYHPPAGWLNGSVHVMHVLQATQPMMDKCKLDRLQGRLKNREESVQCSNPAIREAFAAEGFPHMDKVDAFLEKKLELARQFDAQKLPEEELSGGIDKAFDELLATAQ